MRSRLPEPTTGVDVWRRRPQPPNPRGNTNSNTTRSPVSPWACRGAKGCWGLKFAGAIAGFGEWVRRGQLVRARTCCSRTCCSRTVLPPPHPAPAAGRRVAYHYPKARFCPKPWPTIPVPSRPAPKGRRGEFMGTGVWGSRRGFPAPAGRWLAVDGGCPTTSPCVRRQ